MTAYEVPTIEHSDWSDAEERVDLFTITRPNPDFDEVQGENDGNRREVATTYSMPGKPHPGLGLAFLRMARVAGSEIAMSWLLEEAVGTEGYLALAAEPDIQPGVIAGIMKRARDVVLGGLEAPKG